MDSCDWGYTCENGPETWARKYPAAGGNRQSPIDIDTSRLGGCSCAPLLEMKYSLDHPRSVTNTGHSWSVDENGYDSQLRGGPLGKDLYKLKNWHCHWGVNNDEGSEHTVDGLSFSGELHFVHWNTSRYTTFEEACERLEGLAAISVLLTVGLKNEELDKVVRLLPFITYKNDRVTLTDPLDILQVLPTNKSYWTYNGSLTTPPCSEFVTWIIFKEPIQVSTEQLAAMRMLRSGEAVFGVEAKKLVYNHRPTMPIGKRVVREPISRTTRLPIGIVGLWFLTFLFSSARQLYIVLWTKWLKHSPRQIKERNAAVLVWILLLRQLLNQMTVILRICPYFLTIVLVLC